MLPWPRALLVAAALAALPSPLRAADPTAIPAATGIKRGLVLWLGAGDGADALKLAGSGPYTLHALDKDPAAVAKARAAALSSHLAEKSAFETWSKSALPYADNLANLVVDEGTLGIPEAELQRVLAPGGVLYRKVGEKYTTWIKPRPAGMDDWGHHQHGPDANPTSRDTLDQMPTSLRWNAGRTLGPGPFALRSANGRNFYFWDLYVGNNPQPRSADFSRRMNGIDCEVRDAFNGLLLWEKKFPTLSLPQRPVIVGDRLFLIVAGKLTAIDAATGATLTTYPEATGKLPNTDRPIAPVDSPAVPHDFIVADGILITRDLAGVKAFNANETAPEGKALWTVAAEDDPRLPQKTPPANFMPSWRPDFLVAGNGHVYFTETRRSQSTTTDAKGRSSTKTEQTQFVVGLDLKTGKETLRIPEADLGAKPHPCFFYNGWLYLTSANGFHGVNLADPKQAWTFKGGWHKTFMDDKRWWNPAAYMAAAGKIWIRVEPQVKVDKNHPALTPEEQQIPAKGWIALDPLTGKEARRIAYPTTQPWSGRCYGDIASDHFIMSEGMEFIDIADASFANFRAIRGLCGSGFIMANNMIYTPPVFCIYCFPMLRGAVAVAPPPKNPIVVSDAERLAKGPAYGAVAPVEDGKPGAWTMYRANASRNNYTPMGAQAATLQWQANLGSLGTQPIIAQDKVLSAAINQHRLVAFDAVTGKEAWSFTTAGRIDTAPTFTQGLVLVGSHDGCVYALRATDGVLAWKFTAAPELRRIVAFEQLESPWPVMGSILVNGSTAYVLAGQITRADGGMHLYALDASTGKVLWHQTLTGIYGQGATIKPIHWYIHEEHMTNNVLQLGMPNGDTFLRLYDQHGGWELAAKDGQLRKQSAGVSQPGFAPTGAGVTPGDVKSEAKLPWVGWDRITISYLFRGQNPAFKDMIGMDPRTRGTPSKNLFLFAEPKGLGLNVRWAGGQTTVAPIRWDDPKAADLPWSETQLTGEPAAALIAADTAWIATVTDNGRAGLLTAITLADGKQTAQLTLPAAPAFDGLSASGGSLYLSTTDGQILRIGK